ncbi:MAG TPA: GMC family oxidoreductase [Thermomicrobiales bacterium]|nr:GMC family oxidoreductase [Thermomicrobiales bacterium]
MEREGPDGTYDAVIVGSGFGGSVMAHRLAEAGRRVCVLERGQAYPPGSFPRSPVGMRRNFWDPSEGLHGLFNIWSFRGLAAVVASGLGGGSLIYANVLLRKDRNWFVRDTVTNGHREHWPLGYDDLVPHYERVEAMMGVQKFPFEHEPYSRTPKTVHFRQAADQLGLDWWLPNLAVTFGNPGEPPVPGEPIREERENLHRHTRATCWLCGECDIGCNYGSKNTLDYTYLTAAWHAGAELWPLHEVRSFQPRPEGGYDVHFVVHSPDAGRESTSRAPQRTIHARRLILSAGTLGTTYLLLRNRAVVPRISKRLGMNFSGNGDLLTFASNATDSSTGDRRPRLLEAGRGPVITSTIRVRDAVDEGGSGRGFYLQDAGYPEFANWMLQMTDVVGTTRRGLSLAARLLRLRLGGRIESDIGAELAGLVGDAARSAGLLPLLGMGRDLANGRMVLTDGQLDIDWRRAGSETYFNRVRDTMRRVAEVLGADFIDNPLWHAGRVITVHPLGGCSMGTTIEQGVVNEWGEVFGYPDLTIADGSVMPGPVGANPSLTIAALADRFADRILQVPEGAAP